MNIRPAAPRDIDGIARVHVAGWHENYRGILADSFIEQRTLDQRRTTWREALQQNDRVVFVAENADRIVGFASTLILNPQVSGFAAFLQAIYLLNEAKGQGVGRRLLGALAAALLEKDCTNLALRVLRRNPARAFYERLGARLIPEGIPIEAGEFDDVVYGFDDITKLSRPFDTSGRPSTGSG